MKSIPLTKGKFALVDDEDYEYINQWNWCLASGYAKRNKGGNRNWNMQNEIMNPPNGMWVDHIDGNRLNNQKSNLRICTPSQNSKNRGLRNDNKTGYKGVSRKGNGWLVRLYNDGKIVYCKYFHCLEDAVHAYDKEAKRQFGEFARLNFPE